MEVIIQDLKIKIQEFMQIADHLLERQHSQVQDEVIMEGMSMKENLTSFI